MYVLACFPTTTDGNAPESRGQEMADKRTLDYDAIRGVSTDEGGWFNGERSEGEPEGKR